VKRLLILVLGIALLAPSVVRAQTPSDDPAALKLAEPDFSLIGLPTNLRLPKFGSAFRVTHRFSCPLNEDNAASDLFGIDCGAQIGLEYRFGIMPNTQIGIHRTSNKTIEFFGEYAAIRQSAGHALDVSALLTIEGTNNFQDSYSPAIGAIVSRTIGDVAAIYVEPIWVNNTNTLPKELADDNNSFMVGIGARIRVRPTVYITGEVAPRTGYKGATAGSTQDAVTHASFAIEKRAGGHLFQLNFSNAFGTTMAQIARGGPVGNDWYLGFNISRKFF
jgi:uncharacterized beta barrel domain-containing protein DUF5777